MRHHADATDGIHTTVYMRARMAMLCSSAHVHPPPARTLTSGVSALVVSLIAVGAPMAAMVTFALSLPGDATALLEVYVVVTLTLSRSTGLFVGAQFLRAIV